MSAIKLATRYAKSLLDFAVEKGKLEDVHRDQLFLKAVLKESKEFGQMLSSPLINSDKKLKAIKTVMEGKVCEISMLYFQLLVKKSREIFLKEMVVSFLLQYDQYKHITRAKITSATPLDKKEIDLILEKLKEQANVEHVVLSTEVDDSLVGGFVLQYGDKQYDASISRQISIIRKGMEDNEYLRKLR